MITESKSSTDRLRDVTTSRNTVQRREVIGVLSQVPGFVSAQDLHTLIEREGGHIALATVYTQLKKLVQNGDVDVVMTDRGESLYRRCVVESHHHHLSCRLCGTTVEVDAPELEKWAHDIGERFGFRELRHVVEFNGVCATCQSN
jgi:Fur family transcriptional regulator, ferric uptake regulator